MSDKEKILKTLSSLLETGILTFSDVRKELITNFKFKKDDLVNKLIRFLEENVIHCAMDNNYK